MVQDENQWWYHKGLTRTQAEERLIISGKDGVFLVRDSSSSPGNFVLSMLNNVSLYVIPNFLSPSTQLSYIEQNEVLHYQIRRHRDALFSIEDQTPVNGLNALVEQYRMSQGGSATPLKGSPPPPVPHRIGCTTLLHRATKKGNLEIVVAKLKTSNQTHLDAKDQDGRTVVHLACMLTENAESILEHLIKSGAKVHCRDGEDNTPLHYACRTQSVSLIQKLIDAHAKINARNIHTGWVPLHEAASAGNIDVVKLLVEQGGVPHLPRTKQLQTPAQLARLGCHHETAEYLNNFTPPFPTTSASQWQHETLSRDEAARILSLFIRQNLPEQDDASGVFLIRHSQRKNAQILVISEDRKNFRNYVIKRSNEYYFIDEGPYMLSLEHLVQHYMNFADGLLSKLRYPVAPKPKPPLPAISVTSPILQTKWSGQRVVTKANFDLTLNERLNAALARQKQIFSEDSNESSTKMQPKKYGDHSPLSDDLMNQVGLPTPMTSMKPQRPLIGKKPIVPQKPFSPRFQRKLPESGNQAKSKPDNSIDNQMQTNDEMFNRIQILL